MLIGEQVHLCLYMVYLNGIMNYAYTGILQWMDNSKCGTHIFVCVQMHLYTYILLFRHSSSG